MNDIIDNTILKPDASSSISVSGNWTKAASGAFTANSGTVTFNGTSAQTVTTNNQTFYGLTVSNTHVNGVTFTDAWTATNFTDTTADSVLKFQNGTTYTISGTLNLNGTSGHPIVINTDDGSDANFVFDVTGGSPNLTNLTVNHANAATNNIRCLTSNGCTDGGTNNTGGPAKKWLFVLERSNAIFFAGD